MSSAVLQSLRVPPSPPPPRDPSTATLATRPPRLALAPSARIHRRATVLCSAEHSEIFFVVAFACATVDAVILDCVVYSLDNQFVNYVEFEEFYLK
ncbi:hypothetical protein QJS10_CPA16g01707 [Acorus calamus]|uniref:Uncharacterized protein n=1 Tax=Acorus calamus TaxID=4465 RepID=A0AAV9D1E5_ACOCL|nr:hypothetical protein QJS10_CPA16g01707 [Acorus calamus]